MQTFHTVRELGWTNVAPTITPASPMSTTPFPSLSSSSDPNVRNLVPATESRCERCSERSFRHGIACCINVQHCIPIRKLVKHDARLAVSVSAKHCSNTTYVDSAIFIIKSSSYEDYSVTPRVATNEQRGSTVCKSSAHDPRFTCAVWANTMPTSPTSATPSASAKRCCKRTASSMASVC